MRSSEFSLANRALVQCAQYLSLRFSSVDERKMHAYTKYCFKIQKNFLRIKMRPLSDFVIEQNSSRLCFGLEKKSVLKLQKKSILTRKLLFYEVVIWIGKDNSFEIVEKHFDIKNVRI